MICPNCGSNIPDQAKFCPRCGSAVSNTGFTGGTGFTGQPGYNQNPTPNPYDTQTGGGYNPNLPVPGAYLKADRSLAMYIILSIFTCGIYGYWFLYNMAHDVNIACQGDGENTTGLIGFILLSFVTCGIYGIIWEYKLGNRLASNAPRYNMHFQENGTTVLLWAFLGSWLCGIGGFVAMHILIKNSNQICAAYNRANGAY